MKKTILVIFALVFICSCAAAQNATAERLIVGLWTDNQGSEWIFTADGSLTVGGSTGNYNGTTGKYTGTQLFLGRVVYNISIHSNGRIIILTLNGGDHRDVYLLTKN